MGIISRELVLKIANEGTKAYVLQAELGITRAQARRLRAMADGVLLTEPHQAPVNILVIGDAHAMPDEDMSRFTLLGRTINKLRPDIVLSIGDWADMPSLSSYDKGKLGFEGRRYKRDIEAANAALGLMEAEIEYSPRKVFITGNHEERINRVGEHSPELAGLLSLDDLDIHREWESYPFLVPARIGGVLFSHFFASGVMARPIGGLNKGRSLILKTLQSTVSGHSHEHHHAVAHRADGTRVHGLDVGCAFDGDHAWAGPANRLYWRGVCHLRGVRNGEFDLDMITFPEMERLYG